MIVLHSGLDGLDLAIRASATPELVEELEAGKAFATEQQCEAHTTFNGVTIDIRSSGRTGGYAFTFSTGAMGAIWAVKRPKAGDPWGVHVSIRSRALAIDGLEKVRADLDETCRKLGFRVPPDGISIGRVDFAVDILAPDFVLDPNAFVMHARINRKGIAEIDQMDTNGHSGRVTSVTLGRMPGRQAIVYDKRAEVMVRRKHEWPVIWNAALAAMSLPPLDLANRRSSQVWRIELRLGKKALRDRADIRCWGSFYARLQREMDQLAQDMTLHIPTCDSNRSRWPLHPIWRIAQEAVAERLFQQDARVPPEVVRQIDREEKQRDFLKLLAAHSVTLGYLSGESPEGFAAYCATLPATVLRFLDHHQRGVEERFREAANKYGELIGE